MPDGTIESDSNCGEFKALICQVRPLARVQSYKSFFFTNEEFSLVFASKLGHFIINDFFFV
jgi:hypothetical protein